jgi:hypothetical protein
MCESPAEESDGSRSGSGRGEEEWLVCAAARPPQVEQSQRHEDQHGRTDRQGDFSCAPCAAWAWEDVTATTTGAGRVALIGDDGRSMLPTMHRERSLAYEVCGQRSVRIRVTPRDRTNRVDLRVTTPET